MQTIFSILCVMLQILQLINNMLSLNGQSLQTNYNCTKEDFLYLMAKTILLLSNGESYNLCNVKKKCHENISEVSQGYRWSQ